MNEESRPDQWVTIAEAARTLGLPKGYVRRMTLRLSDADRTLSPDGWTRVRLEALQELNVAAENDPQPAFQALYGREGANTAALVTHLQEEIAFLWGELERRNQAEAELRQLMLLDRRELMNLRQRVAHLEAGPEAPVTHSEPTEESRSAGDYEAAQAPDAETPAYGYEERLEAEELKETVSLAQDAILESQDAQPAYETPGPAAPAPPTEPETIAPEPVAELETTAPEPVAEQETAAPEPPAELETAVPQAAVEAELETTAPEPVAERETAAPEPPAELEMAASEATSELETTAPEAVVKAEEPEPVADEPYPAAPVAASLLLSPDESDDMVSAALRDLDEAIRSITEGLPEITSPVTPSANRFAPLTTPSYPATPAAIPIDATPPVNRNESKTVAFPAGNDAPPPAPASYTQAAPLPTIISPADYLSSAEPPPVPTSSPVNVIYEPGSFSATTSALPSPVSNSVRLAPLDHEMSDILIPPDNQPPPAAAETAAKAETHPVTLETFEEQEPEYRNGGRTSATTVPRADATKLPRIPINVETGLDRASAGIDYVGLAALLQEHRNKARSAEPEPEPGRPSAPERPVIRLEKEIPPSGISAQPIHSDTRKIPNSPAHTSAGETDAFLSIDEEESDPISRLRGRDTRGAASSPTPAPPSPTSPVGTPRQQPPPVRTDDPGKRISGKHPFFSPGEDDDDTPPAGAPGGRKWWQFWKR